MGRDENIKNSWADRNLNYIVSWAEMKRRNSWADKSELHYFYKDEKFQEFKGKERTSKANQNSKYNFTVNTSIMVTQVK